MSIRMRTESARIVSGSAAAVTLAGAAALHGLWATGSPWPRSTQDELADLVVGRRPMPGAAPRAAVTIALATAACVTVRATAGAPGRVTALSRTVAALVSAALLARGAGGAVAELAEVGTATPEFRRWNRRLYNPLCLSLGVLVAIGRQRRET